MEESTTEETTEETIEEANVENVVVEEKIENIASTNIVSPQTEKLEEEIDENSIYFFTENQKGIIYRRIPIRPLVCFEIENCLTSVLFDKITFSRF